MDKYAVIVAGGSGNRMGTVVPKQFLMLQDKPVLWFTLQAFLRSFNDVRIILVLPAMYLKEGQDIIQMTSNADRVEIVEGGSTRFHSVKNGLQNVPVNCVVFVHDGVRCMITPELIQRCYETTVAKGNAIPAVTAVDTIRIETEDGNKLVDRTKVKIIQTPQTFISDTLLKAYDQEYTESFTDDASVVESLGEKLHLVEGDVTNIKITRKLDLLIAGQMLINGDV